MIRNRKLRSMVRTAGSRARVDALIDGVRLRIDTFPRGRIGRRLSEHRYQPLPWLGLTGSYRSEWTGQRLATMLPVVTELGVRTAVDIGCNAGFLTLRLAEQGIATVGVECDPASFRIATAARRAAGLDARVGMLDLQVSPETVSLLPEADAVVFLSVWHHMARAWGLETATAVLGAIWARTGTVLFFETGENEMPPSFGLPRMNNPTLWVADLLARACPGASIRPLGRHFAVAPDGSRHARGLFAAVRVPA